MQPSKFFFRFGALKGVKTLKYLEKNYVFDKQWVTNIFEKHTIIR